MKQAGSLFCTAIVMSLLSGCTAKKARATSSVKVTNGTQISDGDYPAVVRITIGNFACTATFVTRSIIITAAHCVASGDPVFQGVTADRVAVHPAYSTGVSPNDLAFAQFPRDVAPAVATIRATPPKLNDPFEIVGYGLNDTVSKTGAGTKRVGKNSIQDLSQGFISFEGTAFAGDGSGSDSASGSGDSGGPLFIGQQIAGITSGGSAGGDRKASMYVNLHAPANLDFIRKLGFVLGGPAANQTPVSASNSTNGSAQSPASQSPPIKTEVPPAQPSPIAAGGSGAAQVTSLPIDYN